MRRQKNPDLLALLASIAIPLPAAAASYAVTDIGTLPGCQRSIASSINDRGQVVGTAYANGSNNAVSTAHAFIWDKGVITELSTLPGYSDGSIATKINNRGQVVGYAYNKVTSEAGYISHAFLWQKGKLTDLGTLGGPNSLATSINDKGQIVGSAETNTGQNRAFRTLPNQPINSSTDDLGTIANENGFSGATDINNLGQVVGYMSKDEESAFLWNNSVITDLGFPSALGINNKGQVVGSPKAGALSAGVLWQKGGTIDLGTLGGSGYATAVNNLGQVVGNSSSTKGFQPYLWEKGTMQNLNNLIPVRSGWQLETATAINNRGQIVGEGKIKGQIHAYLLTPIAKAIQSSKFKIQN